MNNFIIFTVTTFLALVGFQASAASVTTCGDDVCFTYDNSTAFGSANVVGNNIFFLPTNFIAESTNTQGAVSTNSTINILVKASTAGLTISRVFLQEQGDYFLEGAASSASAGGMFAATSTTTVCPTGNTMFAFFPCREQRLLNAGALTTKGAFADWSVSSFIDLNKNKNWKSDSSVYLTIENRLAATALTQGDQAFIQKKIVGAGITVVPVPAAVWLLGSALGLLGFARRKRVLAK